MATDLYMVILTVVFSVILVFNVVGNSLVIHIISKKQRTATDYLLLNLASSDMLFGIFLIPKFFTPMITESDILDKPWMCKFLQRDYISITAKFTCIATMMALSLERYFAVCRPHSFKKWFSPRNAKIAIVIFWLMGVVYSIPWYIGKTCNTDERISKICSVLSMISASFELLFMIILWVKIYVSLWLKQTFIQPTAHREIEDRKRKKKVTLCVLAVIISFILSYIPHFAVYVALKYKAFSDSDETGIYAIKITMLLLTANAALDPYLYSFQNPRLRAILRKMFLCKTNEEDVLQPS